MRRILHIIDSLDYTGPATQLLLTAKGLARQAFDVHVCGLDQRAPRLAEFQAAGVETTIVPRRFFLDPLADWRLMRHVRRLRPDVVHTWDSVPAMLGPTAIGQRYVAGKYLIRRWQVGLEWKLEHRFARGAAHYVTNSESVRNWAVENGVSPEKFVIVPSFVEPVPASKFLRAELLERLQLPPDGKLIGVVGRLTPEKRVKDLIWAADLLRVLHDNLRLLVIGDGPLRSQLEEYARLASDLDHIRFLGEGDAVSSIVPHLDVLWNGSENVGQSAAILEAMAAGVPVIASDTLTNRELVIDDETGYLIPLGTRSGRAARARLTDQLFTNSELASRLKAASQARAAKDFSTTSTINKLIEVYDSL